MSAICNIAKHVVNGTPYEVKNRGSHADSKVYQLLLGETTAPLIQQVRDYVAGGEWSHAITGDNAYSYLAAAKVVDCDTPVQKNSTYKIREMCLLQAQTGEKGEMNMLNAFSTPPLDLEDPDLLVANELDHLHPIALKAPFGEERNKVLTKIYTYAQKQAQMIPEMVELIEKVIGNRIRYMQEVSKLMPPKTALVFRGCSGAGKTHALKEYAAKAAGDLDAIVQSTDNTKKDVQKLLPLDMQKIHLFGMSIFKMMMPAVKERYPDLSTVQEGWYNNDGAINTLFKELNSDGFSLILREYDGDFSALCLRVLASDGQTLPFEQVARSFKTCRETRPLLLKHKREEDLYQFTYVDKEGKIHTDEPNLPTDVNAEIEMVKKQVITDKDKVFGAHLSDFVGLTIEEAFKKKLQVK